MNPIVHQRFRKLKGRMAYIGFNQSELAKAIDRSSPYVTERMTGRKEWELGECYKILNILGLTQNELTEYFPPKEDLKWTN